MANPAPIFSGGKTIVPLVAVDSISAYQVVTTDGLIANSATTAHLFKLLGVSKVAILPTFSGRVQVYGLLINSLWSWSLGDKIFLNGTSLSTIAPTTGFLLCVGYADTPTSIIITMETKILL